MTRCLSIIFALLLAILPACADQALPRFDQLLRTNSIPIDGVSGAVTTQGVKPFNLRIDFKAAATQPQKDQANTLANTFDWLDKADASVAQFMIDCSNDGTIPANQRQNVNLMGLWFKSGEKAVALNVWTLIKAALAGSPSVITAIQQHATDNGITLP